jgi:hypothetical protein
MMEVAIAAAAVVAMGSRSCRSGSTYYGASVRLPSLRFAHAMLLASAPTFSIPELYCIVLRLNLSYSPRSIY